MHDDYGHDDYGKEPSWPVALVVGGIVFVVGVIVRVGGWIRTPWDCLSRRFRGTRTPEQEPLNPDAP